MASPNMLRQYMTMVRATPGQRARCGTGDQEGEGHAQRDQLQVGQREVPPPFEQRRLRRRFDAEPLEALGHRGRGHSQVGSDRVQLGHTVERQEERQQDGQQDEAGYASLLRPGVVEGVRDADRLNL